MIIDFHTHAFPAKIAAKTMEKLSATANIPFYGDGTTEGIRANLDKSGADMAVVLTVATRPDNLKKINDYAMSHDGACSGDEKYARFVRFCSVHPSAPDAVDELVRLRSLGVKGIKLHPDYQDFMIDEKRLYPIYEALSELNFIVVFHAGYDPLSPNLVHASPEASARILRDFPRMRVVLAHLGGMYHFDEACELLAGKFENLYLDTAMAAGNATEKQIMSIINRQGAEKMLFGSDFPWHETKTELELIESLPLSDKDKSLILGENARRLLEI